ncbi:MAG: hypothetical protein KGQ49_00520 [Verrucomicrobia bacterium]|nr:hypothetical protein [Verrucomicrobiota bacterium]MBU6445864.1 hypothetical protein [Verrucomicrobiota bacterium]
MSQIEPIRFHREPVRFLIRERKQHPDPLQIMKIAGVFMMVVSPLYHNTPCIAACLLLYGAGATGLAFHMTRTWNQTR